MEYLDGWLAWLLERQYFNIFQWFATIFHPACREQHTPHHTSPSFSLAFYLFSVQRKCWRSLSRTRQMSNVTFICLNNISVRFNHLNRSFVCLLISFFTYLWNRFFSARSKENDTFELKRSRAHTYANTQSSQVNTRCMPRIRWSNKGKCFMFNTVFIWNLFFIVPHSLSLSRLRRRAFLFFHPSWTHRQCLFTLLISYSSYFSTEFNFKRSEWKRRSEGGGDVLAPGTWLQWRHYAYHVILPMS